MTSAAPLRPWRPRVWSRVRARAPRLAPSLGVVAALLWLWRHTLLGSVPIQSGDLLMPTDMAAFRALYWPFWNATLGFPNVETVARLPWVAPFLALPDVVWAQKGLILAAVMGSGLLMLRAARRLGAPVLLACLCAVAYGFNPWIVNRLQHYWLLPGYAVLPLVLALWIRPPRRRGPLTLALWLTLGSTTPHFTVFLWALSFLWAALQGRLRAWRRLAGVFGLYLLLNAFWLVPTAVFTLRVSLVPSVPTWEGEVTFSRFADPAAVLRLQGYWWPLAGIWPPAGLAWLGFGLPLAALLALAGRRGPATVYLLLGALAFALLAVGTHVPFLVRLLVLDGPFAAHLGWLFRDPNKAVGPLAALLLLLAAQAPPGRLGWGALGGLGAYLVFCALGAGPYLRQVYRAHPPPPAFGLAQRALRGREGRALWLPQYYGSLTTWNGANLTPEFPTFSSPVPVLGPYGYNPRSNAAYIGVYFGGLLRATDVNLGRVLPLWGTRWLVVHDDLLPAPLQPPGMVNSLTDWLPSGLAAQGLPGRDFGGVRLYDAGAPLPPFVPEEVSLTGSPLGALFAASNWAGWRPRGEAFVETPHPGVTGLTLLPGEDGRPLLAGGHTVRFAAAVRHFDPGRYWSALDQGGLEWWQWSVLGTLPRMEPNLMLLTRRPGARVESAERLAPGRYRVLLRASRHPTAGAVRVGVNGRSFVAELADPVLREGWTDLGSVTLGGGARVTLTNLYGLNVVGELRLVPAADLAAAGRAWAGLPTTWLWPSGSLCRATPAAGRAGRARDYPVFAAPAALPLERRLAAPGRWTDYDAVRLSLRGAGDGRAVRLWTFSQGVWVNLGEVRVWWRGWREVEVPVAHERFRNVLAASGLGVGTLKVEAPGGQPTAARGLRLLGTPLCSLTFTAPRGQAAFLSGVPTAGPVTVALNGRPLTLRGQGDVPVRLRAGVNVLQISRAAVFRVRALRVRTPAAAPAGSPPAGGGAPACPARWRLHVTSPLYLTGRRGELGGRPVAPAPVNLMNQGYWVPPHLCGALTEVNPWPALGNWSAGASVAGLVLLVGAGLRPRRSRGRPRAEKSSTGEPPG